VHPLARVVSTIGTTLDQLGRKWALVGGLAVSAYVEPRFTRDVDIAVAVRDDSDAESLVATLAGQGYTAAAIVEQEATGRLATVRLHAPSRVGEDIVIDLLFASSGIEPEIAEQATRITLFEGVVVPVAQPGHLFALKLLARDDARRPQDLVDIHALRAVLAEEEVARARTAVQQIESRGCNRGRDLGRAIDEALEGPVP